MKRLNLITILGVISFLVLSTAGVSAQTINYSTTVNAALGQNYSVDVSIELTGIVPAQSSCNNGYNYDVAFNYDIQLNGNAPANLWTLQGTIDCGTNQGIFFNLPTSPGSGTGVTTGNPWRNISDCASATVQSLECNSINLQIQGQGITNQTITIEPPPSGEASKWDKHGDIADSTAYMGTKNASDLKFRTNDVERFRITKEGKVGIGMSEPVERLELEGNLKLSGDIIFSDYADANDTTGKMLFVDKDGRTETKTLYSMRNSMYSLDCYQVTPGDDPVALNTVGLTLPSWANRIFDDKEILYTGVTCPTWVGIGTNNPQTILDVRGDIHARRGVAIGDATIPQAGIHLKNKYLGGGNNRFDKLIIIENHEGRKMLQLENDGLLRAREIKVDEETWADYVFEDNYDLMPIGDLKSFIDKNGHLPNVPSAEEIEADGVNLGETAKITMEKVEELTLYVIDQQEQIDEQQEQIDKQQKLLEEQRKLLEA